ncbi:unnamed protein product [Brachionus calyciflorus]|uniref:Uncharacterized protein n=1 Tax=Brachionus calyciflorus TaxID=104777 RepID=A0A814J631_9BILA|nr:unnamed protein product [Brachionus calyciflorus]
MLRFLTVLFVLNFCILITQSEVAKRQILNGDSGTAVAVDPININFESICEDSRFGPFLNNLVDILKKVRDSVKCPMYDDQSQHKNQMKKRQIVSGNNNSVLSFNAININIESVCKSDDFKPLWQSLADTINNIHNSGFCTIKNYKHF